MNKKLIDINCDLGETIEVADCANDALLMPYISSCNIACGAHTGNEAVISQSIYNAKQHGLKIGAHPSYPDNKNFGRVSVCLSDAELEQSLMGQIDLVLKLSIQQGVEINHIKLHGALYNDVENNLELSALVANLFVENYPSLKVLGLAGGTFQKTCLRKGLSFIAEGFMDRVYLDNGKLCPRTVKGSVLTDVKSCLRQAGLLANKLPIQTITDKSLLITVDSICLHGDNPKALEIAKSLSLKLQHSGIEIK